MDFFERQDRARRNTKLLVAYFALAVMGITAAVYLIAAVIFLQDRHDPASLRWLWHPDLFLGVAAGTSLVILIGSLSKIAGLSKGGPAVATMLGGRPLNPQTTDPDERKLLNVIEEMAIASGTPVPEIFILDGEAGINAFAAGTKPDNAAIGVTRGCMTLLNRDELQGVIAHEFSHILNGDMRLNLRLMGIVFGILCLTIIGRVLLRTRGRKNPLPLLGLALIIIGFIGVFFGRLIKSAVSRQREFLADAAAVQFTRNPDGIGGALKKIGGLVHGSRLQTSRAEEASHLFFGNGLGEAWFGLMATHPPLEARIRAIDPGFDGNFPAVTAQAARPSEREPPLVRPVRGRGPVRAPDLGDLLGPAIAAAAATEPPVIPARSIIAQPGEVTPGHLRFAEKLLASLPEPLVHAAHDPLEAAALVYALVLSDDEKVRETQLAALPGALQTEMRRLHPAVAGIDPRAKLPLMELAVPALRQLSPAQFGRFREIMAQLVEADREIDLFEYALQRLVVRHLEPHFQPLRREIVHYYALKPLLPDCAVVLSALAHLGHDRPGERREAFLTGAGRLGAGASIQLLDLKDCNLPQIDAALNRLAQAAPQIKKTVLDACAHAAAADGKLHVQEGELLRAIADTLDCPMPPFVAD